MVFPITNELEVPEINSPWTPVSKPNAAAITIMYKEGAGWRWEERGALALLCVASFVSRLGDLADVDHEVCDDDKAEDVLPGWGLEEGAGGVLRGGARGAGSGVNDAGERF